MHGYDLHVTDVRCVGASPKDVDSGLLAYVSFRINNALLVDGVTVRRTRDNRVTLSWPARSDAAGRKHPLLRPLDDVSRQRIEAQIIKAIGNNLPGMAS